uniref:DUF4817 domain-containing protein n=1 Tax=Strongyloides stercoralis TaxID=6248 RepID=A0A0K0ELC2_STRER
MIYFASFKIVILILLFLTFSCNTIKLNNEQRTKIVELYREHGCKISVTQREFKNFYNLEKPPNRSTVKNIVEKFNKYGNVADLPRSGRPKTARTDDNIERVRESVTNNKETSLKQRAKELCLSKESLRRIITEDLNFKPYKIQFSEKSENIDTTERLTYVTAFENLVRENDGFLDKLIMSSEAHFYTEGYVNVQNLWVWGSEEPKPITDEPLKAKSVIVWCGVTSKRIIGPYFFEDEDGQTVTVNGLRYREMIQNFLVPQLEGEEEMWFQQSGSPSHTTKETIYLLKSIFGNRLISKKCDINYPSQSPDLSAADFFLWGYLKDQVYKNRPKTIDELKDNIEEEIGYIQQDTLKKVMENVLERVKKVRELNGKYLGDIIFRS